MLRVHRTKCPQPESSTASSVCGASRSAPCSTTVPQSADVVELERTRPSCTDGRHALLRERRFFDRHTFERSFYGTRFGHSPVILKCMLLSLTDRWPCGPAPCTTSKPPLRSLGSQQCRIQFILRRREDRGTEVRRATWSRVSRGAAQALPYCVRARVEKRTSARRRRRRSRSRASFNPLSFKPLVALSSEMESNARCIG